MIYKAFKDLELSTLGMGNMRLPTFPETGLINEEKAREVIESAYENGINYFDTAYRYVGGQSEAFVGKVLNQYPRDTWYLATKMPGHMIRMRKDGRIGLEGFPNDFSVASIAEIFEDQLAKCGVDYFDFYLLHNLCEESIDIYMDESLGIVDYLLEQKKAGKIRYLGFSAHARADTIEKFLAWKDCYDFAQIQLNFLDWTLQDAKAKYELLEKHELPIVVMEPCRGGRLINLDEESIAAMKKIRPDDSIASWSFRYVKSLPNVQVVLSGMNNLEQMKDNIKTFSDPGVVSDIENQQLNKIVEKLIKFVPCTACEYCCEGCPKKLKIPMLIALYNEMAFDHSPGLGFAIRALKDEEKPANCISCGKCSRACPQGIDIPDILEKLREKLANMPAMKMPPMPKK